LGGVELGPELLDQPAVLAAAIKTAYARCVDAVNIQLGSQAAAAVPAVNPAQAQAQAQPPPAKPALPAQPAIPPPSTPPAVVNPPANGRTFYGKANGRSQDGPPTTGSQLGGVAKKLGALPWFQQLGASQNPPLPKYVGDWPDEWAVWAYAQYQAACIPPAVPVANGVAPH